MHGGHRNAIRIYIHRYWADITQPNLPPGWIHLFSSRIRYFYSTANPLISDVSI